MKIKKLLIFNITFFPFILLATNIPTIQKTDDYYWMYGISTAVFPTIAYYNMKSIENSAKEIAKQNNVKKIFKKLPESPLKMQIRRQYYLLKGAAIDNVEISFSIRELFNAGRLKNRVSKASQTKKLDLSNLKISNLNGLFEVLGQIKGTIKDLNLSHNLINIVYNNDFKFYLSQIKTLNLSYNKILSLQSGSLDELINLTFLDLSHNQLEFLPFGIFALLTNLNKLDLSDNPLEYLKPENFIGLKDSLRFLNLADTKIKKIPSYLKEFPKLKNILVYKRKELKKRKRRT
ncbi:hypothetical protein GF322_04420 [Candidatus Dependentiae bacterium]|nr:hypothetical protein [Candidatus Dependentiae bacterium]